MDRTRMEGLEMKGSAETEGARRATGVTADGGQGAVPDPEVPEKAKRRQFSPEYKLRVLREADACRGEGEIGALLRREGLYSSHLTTWRRQRETGALAGMRARKRGPKGRGEDPRLKQQEREIARLQRRLKQAETIIDIQKKVAGILGIPLNAPALDEND
jgi:transposase-like protein